MNAPGINFAYESGIKYKTILICDLIAREWQKNYENTRLEAYFGNKRKSPFAVIVSMIAKGDGPSDWIRTSGHLRFAQLTALRRMHIQEAAGSLLPYEKRPESSCFRVFLVRVTGFEPAAS